MRPHSQQRLTEQKNFSIFFFPSCSFEWLWHYHGQVTPYCSLQHTATLLQRNATYCTTLRHSASHCIAPAQLTHLDYHFSHDSPPISSVCCSALQCVAVCCSVLQCVVVCCSALQNVAVCCSVWQCVTVCCSVCYSLLQCVAGCVALSCSVLQYVTV